MKPDHNHLPQFLLSSLPCYLIDRGQDVGIEISPSIPGHSTAHYVLSSTLLNYAFGYFLLNSALFKSTQLSTESLLYWVQKVYCNEYRKSTVMSTESILYWVQKVYCTEYRKYIVLSTESLLYWVKRVYFTEYRKSTILSKASLLYWVQKVYYTE